MQRGARAVRDVPLDLLHVRIETHRQHAISLVEHTHPKIVERHRAPEQKVEHPSWRSDHDLRATLERVDLWTVTNASVDGNGAQTGVTAHRLGRLPDLFGQLPGRDQHEGLAVRPVGPEPLQHREQERPSLAAARPGLNHHLAASQQVRDRPGLHRHERGPPRTRGSRTQGLRQLVKGKLRELVRLGNRGICFFFQGVPRGPLELRPRCSGAGSPPIRAPFYTRWHSFFASAISWIEM